MSFLDFFRKKRLLRVEWKENDPGILSIRVPIEEGALTEGTELVVHETQLALIVNAGEVLDLYEAGVYKPFKAPFKFDVYFFSAREQLHQKWGTQTPVVVQDRTFGVIRLRAHGSYSYKIRNPRILFKKLSAVGEKFTTEQLEGQLRALVLTSLGTLFGAMSVSIAEISSNQKILSEKLIEGLVPYFSDFGLKLESFLVQSISLPEELQSKVDQLLPDSNDPLQKVKQLHDLLEKGVITPAEFADKKAELLKRVK